MIVTKDNYSIAPFMQSQQLVFDGGVKERRLGNLNFSLKEISLGGPLLEFGVYKGTSINITADLYPERKIHGFDSFQGLPEDWFYNKNQTLKKGHFKRDVPEVRGNVELWIGWFEDTIKQYLQQNNEPISFVHVDSDLYSSCKEILFSLNNLIVKDTLILFDEFYPWGEKPYDFWQQGEYKALGEWISMFDRKMKVMFHNNHQQCVIRIIE